MPLGRLDALGVFVSAHPGDGHLRNRRARFERRRRSNRPPTRDPRRRPDRRRVDLAASPRRSRRSIRNIRARPVRRLSTRSRVLWSVGDQSSIGLADSNRVPSPFFRGRFVPSVPMEYRIFLPLRCGAAADNCRTVHPYDCTIGVRCEELGLTCGDDGRCIDPLLRPDRSGDAAVFRQGEEGGVEIPLGDSGLDAPSDARVEDVTTEDARAADSSCGPSPACAPDTTRSCACNGQERCRADCTWGPCANQCGCNGQPCYRGNCNTGLSCQSGACRPCGAEGQPCCGVNCNSGLTCSSGTCRRPACSPNCPSGRNCGLSDGCGNLCTSCGGCDLTCNPSTRACNITPCPSGTYRCESNCRCCAGCDANDRCCTPPRCS